MKKVFRYIFRTWKDEGEPSHSLMKALPPIVWDFVILLVLFGVIWSIAAGVLSVIR